MFFYSFKSFLYVRLLLFQIKSLSLMWHKTCCLLNHFWRMFYLCGNQAFNSKKLEKHLRKSDILSKDAGRWPASLLKISLPQVFFRHLANKNQLPGLSINGTLVENVLKKNLYKRVDGHIRGFLYKGGSSNLQDTMMLDFWHLPFSEPAFLSIQ